MKKILTAMAKCATKTDSRYDLEVVKVTPKDLTVTDGSQLWVFERDDPMADEAGYEAFIDSKIINALPKDTFAAKITEEGIDFYSETLGTISPRSVPANYPDTSRMLPEPGVDDVCFSMSLNTIKQLKVLMEAEDVKTVDIRVTRDKGPILTRISGRLTGGFMPCVED